MKFITQGETPDLSTNDVREIVETDAQGNELVTAPAAPIKPLPIIWLTNAVSTKTIAEMIATEQYAICIFKDIEEANDIPGYQRPLYVMDKVYLSLPDKEEHLLTNTNDPNKTDSPISFRQARDFCYETFNYAPLKDSLEYDLDYHLLGTKSPPYNPSPSPSPIPTPAPIIAIPIPPKKEKAKAVEEKKSTPSSSSKKRFGDKCPTCKLPFLYDHVAWAQGKTDGYTCRCKKDAPPPSPPLVPLAPRPHTPSPKTTASEQVNPVATPTTTERPFPYVNYDQFNRWVRYHTNYQCIRDMLYYDNDINAKLADWKRLDNMEVHLDEMKGRLDSAWDALDGAQLKLEQAKEDVRKTIHDFPFAYRGIIREKKRVFDNLKYQGIEKKAAAFFRESAQGDEDVKQRKLKKQRKRLGTSHLPSYPRDPKGPIVISSESSSGIEVPIRFQQTPTIDSPNWNRQFAAVGARFIPAQNLTPQVPRIVCYECNSTGHVRKDCGQYKCCFCNRFKPNHSPYHCPYNQDGPAYEGPPDDEPYGDEDGLYGDGEQ